MVDAARFRLVALFACWSYDNWLDLSATRRRMALRGAAPAGEAGPRDWEIILAARFDGPPPEEQVTSNKQLLCRRSPAHITAFSVISQNDHASGDMR
jgi:hypothetical protein